MTLYQRIILIIVSTFIALLFILATTSDLILLSSYSSLEKADITSHTRFISNNINDKLKQLNISVQEAAEQLKENGGLSAVSRHNSSMLFTDRFLRSYGLDLCALYDSAGRLVTINGFNRETNEYSQVPSGKQQALDNLVSEITLIEGSTLQGVVNLAGSPMLVAFSHIRDRNGVKLGVVATGWFIDCVEIERIFGAYGVTVTVHDLNRSLVPDVQKAVTAISGGGNTYAAAIDATSVAGYFTLRNISGQPSFIVRAVEKRVLYEHGKVTIAYIVTALFLAGGVLCCVLLLFVRGTILARLQSLATNVCLIADRRDISARIPLSEHQDEIRTLAVSINSMLESLESAEAGMRESEERYRTLFDRAPDAIIIIGTEGDESGRIMAANQVAADQHGLTVDELCNLYIHDLNTAEANIISRNIFAKVVAGEWVTAEIWHQKKDGTQFPVEIHAGLIKIGGKEYILGFDREISQRKLTEKTDNMYLEQIRQLNNELSRKALDLSAANNELETFNYSVSHDMRGPLTRISGYCQLLLDDENELDPTVKEYVTRIYESETWLNDMIDALLQLAQITRVEIVSDSVNLSAIADEALDELCLEHPDRLVKTYTEPDIVVSGDPLLLKMVMINLLNNAWKYSSLKSEALIEFGVDHAGPDPVYFIRDNGAGFDMKDAHKLFRVFTRLHDSSQFSGTGVGLTTVQRIILRHGGRIWAEAEPGVGATFFFTLP